MTDYNINSDLPRYVPSRNRRNNNEGQQQNKKSNRFYGTTTRGLSTGWKPHHDEQEQHNNSSNENNLSDNEDEIFARPYLPNNHQHDATSSSPSDSRNNVRRQRVVQRLEDFMDERDHDEWGGPTSIRKEYTDDSKAAVLRNGRGVGDASVAEADTTIEQWMKITVEPPANVGHRLLRILGWREGNSSAYVPATADDDNNNNKAHDVSKPDNDAVPEATVVLSKKKLRKIQLQQKRVKIPPPKLDTCGLGYEPYQNAPEFKAYQEKRKLSQQRRAQLNSNVYRVSNVLGGRNFDGTDDQQDDNDPKRHRTKYNNSSDNNLDDELNHEYISHETVEDFVGKRSVGGFALREDEDDAYDEEPMSLTRVTDKVKLDAEEYNKEVYEHSSDEEAHDHVEEFSSKRKNNAGEHRGTANNAGNHNDNTDDILGVLSSFADTGGTGALSVGTTNPTKSVTSDGRPPLAGFVLGGAFTSHSMSKRYRGPDVPLSYQVSRHEFGPDENPMVLKALSRAVQLEAIDEKRRQALDDALRMNAFSNAPSKRTQASLSNNVSTQEAQNTSCERSQAPMAGGAFSALAEAMKNRFTSVVENGSDDKNVEAGLRIPSKDKGLSKPNDNGIARDDTPPDGASRNSTTQAEKEIRIHRTVRLFAPHRLLCKRFHVSVPTSSTAGTNEPSRVTESSYFHQEILNPATAAAVAQKKQGDSSKSAQQKQSVSKMASIFNQDGTMKEEAVAESMTEAKEDRPDIEVFKSIFEPESDMDESETEDEGDGDRTEGVNAQDGPNININETDAENLDKSDTKSNDGEEKREPSELVMVPYNDRHNEKKRKRSKSKKHRKKRSRSSSSDGSSDLSGDSSGSYHSRDRKRDRDRKESRRKKKRQKQKKKKSRH